MVEQLFNNAYSLIKERGYDQIIIALDVHGTVFKPNYSTELVMEFHDNAKRALQKLSKRKDVVMYLYTCSYDKYSEEYANELLSQGITVYMTPKSAMDALGIKNTEFQCFDHKPYFNIILDDKAGFSPEADWIKIAQYYEKMP